MITQSIRKITFDDLKDFNSILVALFIFLAILMPADHLNVKIFVFALLLMVNIKTIVDFLLDRRHLYYAFFTVIFPLCIFLLSIVHAPVQITVSKLYVFSYMWLLPIIVKYKINYLNYILNTLMILSLIICTSALLDMLGVLSISANPLLMYFHMAGEAQISTSVNAIFYYVIFLNGSPLILALLLYSLFKEKWFWSIISFAALLLSGTRANIYEALFFTVLYFLFLVHNKMIKKAAWIIMILLIVRYFNAFKARIININEAKTTGDSIRTSNIKDILYSMQKNPLSYLIGNGVGSRYFSEARQEWLPDSELSYLEFFRQTGIIGLSLFIYFLLNPLKSLLQYKNIRWLAFFYLGFLAISFIDPFLFTSTGFIIYLLVYSVYENLKQPELSFEASRRIQMEGSND